MTETNKTNENMIIEYKALRDEVTARLKIQTDILAFMLAGLAVLFGIAFRYEVHEIFLIIPFLTITTGFLYVSTIARVAEIGEYIKTRIEDKTNGLGWENYLESKIYKRRSINFAYRIGAILIFIIPTIISLLVYILSRWVIIKLLLSLAIIIFAIIGMYVILLFILCDALYYSTKKR